MSLINNTYFFNEFSIGNKSSPPVAERLEEYIANYEPEFLEGILGADFAALFNANFIEARFVTLKDRLLKNPSPIAAYVFFVYQEYQGLQATSGSDAKIKIENATASTPVYRRVAAWNGMVDSSWKIINWLKDNKDTYPEFDICKVDGSFFIKTNDMGL